MEAETSWDFVIAELREMAIDNCEGDLAVAILGIEAIIEDPTQYSVKRIELDFALASKCLIHQLSYTTEARLDGGHIGHKSMVEYYGGTMLQFSELLTGLALKCIELKEQVQAKPAEQPAVESSPTIQ